MFTIVFQLKRTPQENHHQRPSTLKLSPLIFQVSLSWSSTKNMMNEILYSAQILRKSCPDFSIRTQYKWTLSTKPCPNFYKPWPDFYRKAPNFEPKLVSRFYKLCHDFCRISIINFETIINSIICSWEMLTNVSKTLIKETNIFELVK